MNAAVLVVLLAVAYVSADCGCLKCSKDLTIGGHSLPMPECGPVKVIYRGAAAGRGCYPGQQLPLTIQAPLPAAPLAVETVFRKDLPCKIVAPTPATHWYEQPAGWRHEYKVQAPLSIPAGPIISAAPVATNLKACVDRVVLPAPVSDCATGDRMYNTMISEAPAFESSRYVRRSGCFNPDFDTYVSHQPAWSSVHHSVGPVFTSPIIGSSCRSSPLTYRLPSGPALDVCNNRCEARKVVCRYRNEIIPTRNSASFDNASVPALDVKNREKREVPFLKHGYKFFMNMLPDFVQGPIKNTVNTFALTHPDKKLQALYNQPRALSLREKILLQSQKNMRILKKKLLGRRLKSVSKKPLADDYAIDKAARTFLSNLKTPTQYSSNPWLNKVRSRMPDIEEDPNSEQSPTKRTWLDFDSNLGAAEFLNEFGRSAADSRKDAQLTEHEKYMFRSKLNKLDEHSKGRSKRSSIYQNYLKKYRQDPDEHVILGSDELVLPFYQVKVEDGSEESRTDAHYYDNEYVGAASREEMLRKIIRKELAKYTYEQSTEAKSTQDPFNFNNAVPHSPLFHLMNLPIRVLKHFHELGKHAFPVVSSVPKAITTSKKYFRDFGKNFKRNMLHLASDVIGDFDNLDSNNLILGPSRYRRSTDTNDVEDEMQIEKRKEQYEPDYSLVFEYGTSAENGPDYHDAKVRRKRYILKMVDEDEVEEYLVDKLGSYLGYTEGKKRKKDKVSSARKYAEEGCPTCQTYRNNMASASFEDDHGQKKVLLEQLKPKIIIDNNGLPFLEIGGYKKPMPRRLKKNKDKRYRYQKDSFENFKPYFSSGEVDSDKIGYLIDHAKDHVASSYSERFSGMPVKTIKEKISQLLFETDLLVHMDFDKYDDIYDNLIALQHIKSAVEQDWKRLVMSKRIDDMNGKIALLGKFQEMQQFKDTTLRGVVFAISEEHENKFITKKFLKILVRLQKLQCIINQVVENVQARLHMGSKVDMRQEIKYVDFFMGLNFVNAKTRNEMICNLKKDRDSALQQNIELLDKLKKLLIFDGDSEKINEEASLLWEMRNIEKLLRSAIEDMVERLNDGYKIKKELKILFDLLKRYETCEAEQKKLLLQFEEGSLEGMSGEDSNENVNITGSKRGASKKKFDIEEFRGRLQERLKKRQMLLRKKLRNHSNRKSKVESCESDEDE